MRRITMTAAAAAITLGSLLGTTGTAAAEPDVTPHQCSTGGGVPHIVMMSWLPPALNGWCEGGQYDGHNLHFG